MNLNKQNKISVLLKLISLTIIMLISFMFILPNKNTSAEKNNGFYKSVMNLNNENDDKNEDKINAISVFNSNTNNITNIDLQGHNIKITDSIVCFYTSIEDKYSVLEEVCNSYINELNLDISNISQIELLGVISSSNEKNRITYLNESGEMAPEIYNAEVINDNLSGLKLKVTLEEIETIEPETIVEETNELLSGETKVIQGGQGNKLLNKEITYYGLNKDNENIVSENIITPVVNTIVKTGIKSPYEAGVAFLSSPTKGGYVSSTFGEVRSNSVHKGIDIAKDLGEDVSAALEGEVIYAGYNNGGYGNLIILQHNNNMKTYYAHLSNIYVSVGEIVKKNDLIGEIGSTGNSTGPHLHFELRVDNNPVNPIKYIQQ